MINTDLRYLRVLILEDDANYVELLKLNLTSFKIKHLTFVSTFEEALATYRKRDFDLLILDINLDKEKSTGDDFARVVRSSEDSVPIIYLTSYFNEDIYERVRDTHPSSFLDKDCSTLELKQAIDLEILKQANQPQSQGVDTASNNKFFFKVGNIYKGIDPTEISYFFSENSTTYARVKERNFPTSTRLKSLEGSLKKQGFLRAHKKYLVNINHIEQIDTQSSKLKIGSESIPIGYAFKMSFLNRLQTFR